MAAFEDEPGLLAEPDRPKRDAFRWTPPPAPAPPARQYELTDVHRRLIAKAREVAALTSTEARRERYGENDPEMARAAALGEAQFLLLELVAIITHMEGSVPGPQDGKNSTEEKP